MSEETDAALDEMEDPSKTWECFHCGAVLVGRQAAADHFGTGNYEGEVPICIEAATVPLQDLVKTNREMWERLLKVEEDLEQAEFQRDCWAQASRKELGDPYATWHDFSKRREDIRGELLATQSLLRHLINELADVYLFTCAWRNYDPNLVSPQDYLKSMDNAETNRRHI